MRPRGYNSNHGFDATLEGCTLERRRSLIDMTISVPIRIYAAANCHLLESRFNATNASDETSRRNA